MLHIEVRRITSTLSTRNPALSFMTVELLTRWEPRVTPISIDLQTATLRIFDDQGDKVPLNKTRKISGVIQADIPELSFPVNIPLVSRDIKQLDNDEDTNSVDSHLRWAYDNVVEMVSGDQHFEPVASETVMQRGQRMKVQYLFEEDPAESDLVYKTPAAIVKVNLDFELNNIPLP